MERQETLGCSWLASASGPDLTDRQGCFGTGSSEPGLWLPLPFQQEFYGLTFYAGFISIVRSFDKYDGIVLGTQRGTRNTPCPRGSQSNWEAQSEQSAQNRVARSVHAHCGEGLREATGTAVGGPTLREQKTEEVCLAGNREPPWPKSDPSVNLLFRSLVYLPCLLL